LVTLLPDRRKQSEIRRVAMSEAEITMPQPGTDGGWPGCHPTRHFAVGFGRVARIRGDAPIERASLKRRTEAGPSNALRLLALCTRSSATRRSRTIGRWSDLPLFSARALTQLSPRTRHRSRRKRRRFCWIWVASRGPTSRKPCSIVGPKALKSPMTAVGPSRWLTIRANWRRLSNCPCDR